MHTVLVPHRITQREKRSDSPCRPSRIVDSIADLVPISA